MTQFSAFVGVDQTGATSHKGIPKPLPAAVIYKEGAVWNLIFSDGPDRLELPSVTRPEILNLLFSTSLHGRDLSRTALILDSVFGLPKSSWPFQSGGGADQLFQLFRRAHQFSFAGKEFGRDTAEQFFGLFLKSKQKSPLPQRVCEVRSGANSIFLTRPYQRNIGCGTFRIWKELGSSPEKWFQIWGFDDPAPQLQDGPWIFEAYPTLFWKKILGSASRQPKDLLRWLKTEAPSNLKIQPFQNSLLLEDRDLCDSVVLAICAWILQERSEIWQIPNFPERPQEGWILGL